MRAFASFIATLVCLGVAFSLLHVVILWLQLPDVMALLLFAIPIVLYIAYCTGTTRAQTLRSALTIYLGFSGVVLAAAGLVYLIG